MERKNPGITRETAFELLTEKLGHKDRLFKHSLASEAILRKLAERLGEDPDFYGIAGLLHDIDLGWLEEDLAEHAIQGADFLAERGVHEEITTAIRRHNKQLDLARETTLDHALAAGETVTGLVIAAALVYPDKKLASVKPKSVRKRYKEKAFAAGADRAIIAECEQVGIPLSDFLDLSLEALKEIADDLGL
ncbi:MAG: HDIG domain-containing protein [Candidatus Lernaella stagnicola]|nr:HDIG domain-containing protein [Candidatus Lernaella stagnicola]